MAEAKPTFEQELSELEKIVDQLERGELSLEESVSLFERGMGLSESCKEQLASAESRIQVLMNPREKGPVKTQPLPEADDDETSAAF